MVDRLVVAALTPWACTASYTVKPQINESEDRKEHVCHTVILATPSLTYQNNNTVAVYP